MIKIALFGAAPDTGNMGVSALFHSAISGILDFLPEAEIIVMDNGWGKRLVRHSLSDNKVKSLVHFGSRGGRKYYKSENLASQAFLASFGFVGSMLNPILRELDECDAILDISGGDSFSDIYGAKRFLNVVRPKQMALKRNIPLILLPQTYGPYSDPKFEKMAREAVGEASMAWARDIRSFDNLKKLLGSNFDEKRHLCGIDLAFRLNTRSAESEIDEKLKGFLAANRSQYPVIGLNISGLIYQDPENAVNQYGFKADYIDLMHRFLLTALENTSSKIVVIPHVMNIQGHYESDYGASLEAVNSIGERYSDRISISPNTLDQNQTKWLISKMDWFCGTRMHSTIAALSSGVPTCAVAYSDKTLGVFESCGQGDQVADPRKKSTDEMLSHLLASFDNRLELRESLAEHLPAVHQQSEKQLQIIADTIQNI